jgi:RNA polymerase sigma-70 factor (ECF subfamily)
VPTASTGTTGPSRELIDAALDGDDDAFRRVVEPHRTELHAHCYRMLGSVHDADDALQDTLLRAWRGLARFEDGRRLRPWLYKIATNVCIDALGRRSKRILPIDGRPPTAPGAEGDEPLEQSVWIEPYPDERFGVGDGYATPECRYEQRESVELAFIAALQHLPARQRAVLVLREVLGFSAREVAHALDTTVASVNSALQRARKTVDERLPSESQQVSLRSLGDERIRDLVDRFIDAFESGDVEAILGLLTADATFAMPPYPDWCRGRDAVGKSWLMPDGPPPRLRYVPTRANGQLALGTYVLDADRGTYVPLALDVLIVRGAEIAGVIAFRTPEVLGSFGLPAELSR